MSPSPIAYGPCVLSAQNIQDGLLIVRFNEPMTQIDNFLQIGNYTVNPSSGAAELVITEVRVNPTQSSAAVLSFEGGLGDYELIVNNVFDANGNEIDPTCNRVLFTVTRPGGEVAPSIHLFDTVFGTMGMTQRVVIRRTVDQLTVNRAIDLAMNQQLTQRLDASNAALPLRSGKDGGRRR